MGLSAALAGPTGNAVGLGCRRLAAKIADRRGEIDQQITKVTYAEAKQEVANEDDARSHARRWHRDRCRAIRRRRQCDHLDQLRPRLTSLTTDQLLTEGYEVCRYIDVGRLASDALPVVMTDLQVTVTAAMAFIPAAVVQLDC